MYRNIAIVKLSAIGDVIHAMPVAAALRECFPQARISWIVEQAAAPLLESNPCVDEIVIFHKKKFKSVGSFFQEAPRFIGELRGRSFDLTLDLQGLLKSGLIGWFSGASKRLVYENTREGSQYFAERIVGPNAGGHVVERYLDVVRSLGCSAEKVWFPMVLQEGEEERAARQAAHYGLHPGLPYVVFGLGANWPNKIWPTGHFARLGDLLYQDHVIPVMIGGAGDTLLADRVRREMAIPPVDLTGKTDLRELACLVKNARAFVGGDTGPMHLAAAMGTSVAALMGPTDALRNGPYHRYANYGDPITHKVVEVNRECAGCWKRRCPKNLDCLSAIGPEEIHEWLKTL